MTHSLQVTPGGRATLIDWGPERGLQCSNRSSARIQACAEESDKGVCATMGTLPQGTIAPRPGQTIVPEFDMPGVTSGSAGNPA